MNTSESGNVLFLIFLGIALLAALTFTFTQGSRTGAQNLTREQTSLAATEIIAYGNTIADAVQRLKLRGCSDTEISFENNFVGGYTNGTDTGCQVFHNDGGNINYMAPSSSWIVSPGAEEWVFSAFQRIDGAGSNTAAGDLALYLLYVNGDVCKAINEKLGINPVGEYPVDASSLILGKFTGSYGSGNPPNNTDAAVQGKLIGCIDNSFSSRYLYYHTLLVTD